MALVERVTNILLKPKVEWPRIAEESATTSSVFTGYVMILAAIGPLALALTGAWVSPWPATGSGSASPGCWR